MPSTHATNAGGTNEIVIKLKTSLIILNKNTVKLLYSIIDIRKGQMVYLNYTATLF